MAGGQGQPRAVRVHSARQIAQVRALAGALRVWLLSPPGVAGFFGLAGFRAQLLEAGALEDGIPDAARAPGHALAALRLGFRTVILEGSVPAYPALAALFGAQGAQLWPEAPPAMDLARVDLGRPAGRRHLAAWLGLPGAGEMA